MLIERRNFRFDHIVDIEGNMDNLHMFYMTNEDIQNDDIVREELLEENESLFVLKKIGEQTSDKYCYIKIKTLIGLDLETKMYIVEKIIIANNLINKNLFVRIFTIILQQNDDNFTNRINVANLDKSYHGNIDNIANEIAEYVTFLFSCFTDSVICRSYNIP